MKKIICLVMLCSMLQLYAMEVVPTDGTTPVVIANRARRVAEPSAPQALVAAQQRIDELTKQNAKLRAQSRCSSCVGRIEGALVTASAGLVLLGLYAKGCSLWQLAASDGEILSCLCLPVH